MDAGNPDPLDMSYEEWQMVGTEYFSRRDLYALPWSYGARGAPGINLEYMRVFPCQFGGPIAVCRDETKVVLQLGAFGSRPDIQIFSAAGSPLGRILWDGGRIVAAGWTDIEELLVIDDRGRVQRFTCLGQPSQGTPSSYSSLGTTEAMTGTGASQQFSLGAAAESEGLADIVISDHSIVARTAAGHLWCIPDVNQPRPTRYPDPIPAVTSGGAFGAAVHCMCPIPPSLSESGALEVLAAVETTVVTIDSDQVSTSAVYEGPIVKLAISPDGRAVAGYAADDVVYIWSSNLEETLCRVFLGDTADDMADSLGLQNALEVMPSGCPDNFIWCGNDGVMASWNGVGALLVLLKDGGFRWWDVGPGAATLVGEVDGVRALTSEHHVLFRLVPPPLASVLEIGSTSPGALLYDARKLYDERDARAAAELLEVLRCGELPSASSTCLGAAAAEMDPVKQESLMRAGCYGRAFIALNPDDAQNSFDDLAPRSTTKISTTTAASDGGRQGKHVVGLARTLRVLNALREPDIALPLTMPQFEALGLSRLLTRLTGRRHYLLALRVCAALEASPENVLFVWACDKIAASASSAPDEELLGVLRSKLDGQEGVKWAAVAAHAQAQGRPRLAAALAEHESCAEDQIPLLIALGEEEGALRKAVDSGDADLILEVLLSMWRRTERQQQQQQKLFSLIARYPSAAALMTKFLRGTGDPDAPMAMWEAAHDFRAIAVCHVETAMNTSTPAPQKVKEWNRAKEAYARDERANGHEDAKFEGAAISVALRLAEVQTDLEKSSGREGFKDLSVVDTIKQCLRLGLRDQAQKIAKEFKVPEKQQMLLSIEASAAVQDWPALQQLASRLDRRAPVTIEHIIAAVRAHNAPVPTIRWFIDRIAGDSGLIRRAQLYSEIGLHREAAMLAEQAEMAGAGAGVLGSLRDAVGGTYVGSLLGGSSSTGGR